jgi:argininosuccinate synthase
MGTAIGRSFIMEEVVAVAKKEGATRIAHGATGKGNDQCRFEFSAWALCPEAKIIAAWRMPKFWRAMHGKPSLPGRKELMEYAQKNGIEIEATLEKPFSTDANIAHMSHESGYLEDPSSRAWRDVYQMTLPICEIGSAVSEFVIGFLDGVPAYVISNFTDSDMNDVQKRNPVEILDLLNNAGRLRGIPPIDMVENRFVGMKSRGVYESPGMTILYAAHRDLEGLCMDRDLMHLRDTLSPKYAELVYNGFWFSPTLEALNAFINVSQKGVTGEVMVRLETGTVQILGRRSPYSLYDASIASMEKGGAYDPRDASGFLKIAGLPTKTRALRDSARKKKGK